MQITKIIETETGHRLTNYSGKCACLHGHRYRWEVTVSAKELDEVGFVIDFDKLKSILKDTVNRIDHAFLFHDQDPLVTALEAQDLEVEDTLKATHGGDGNIFVLPFNPTSENLVNWMATQIMLELPLGIQLHRIKMWKTSSSYTIWNPGFKS